MELVELLELLESVELFEVVELVELLELLELGALEELDELELLELVEFPLPLLEKESLAAATALDTAFMSSSLWPNGPFASHDGNLAISERRPMALRPRLATGLP